MRRLRLQHVWRRRQFLVGVLDLARHECQRDVWSPDVQRVRRSGFSGHGRVFIDQVSVRIVFDDVTGAVEPGIGLAWDA